MTRRTMLIFGVHAIVAFMDLLADGGLNEVCSSVIDESLCVNQLKIRRPVAELSPSLE